MEHTLPELPYGKNQLDPFLTEEAVEIHYEKHHRGYVNKLNEALKDKPDYQSLSLEELICQVPVNSGIFNSAAQIWNHTFFWSCMAPETGRQTECTGELKDAIDKQFGSVSAMLEEFIETGMGQFGSGWVWLVKKPDQSLAVRSTANAECVLTDNDVPLIVCDVWEHAYYVDFRNERKRFLDGFTDFINWEFVEKNFSAS